MVKIRQKSPESVTFPPWAFWRNGYLLTLAVLLLGSLILRIVLAHQLEYPQVDGTYYLDQARELVGRGQLPHSSFPPGFPLLISLVLVVLDLNDPLAPLRAAQTINVVFGAFFGLLTFIYLRKRLPDPLALAGSAIVLFLPHMVFYSKIDMSEMSYACFLLGGWLTWHRERRFISGLLFGYAYLIRPEALFVAAALGILQTFRDRKLPWRFALGILLPVIPYAIFLKTQSGHWTLSSKGVFLSTTLQENRGFELVRFVMRNLVELLSGLVGLLSWPLVLLACAGAFRTKSRWWIPLLPLVFLPFFSFAMLPRFWLPYLPYILMGSGIGTMALHQRLAGTKPRRMIVVGSLVVMIGLAMVARDDVYLYGKKQEVYPNLRQAGLWLRERVSRDTIIAAYKSQPSYWAWSRFTKFPPDLTAVEIIDEAKAAGAQYLVVDVYTSMHFYPELLKLLQDPLPSELGNRITLAYFYSNKVDYRLNTCIYELK